MQTLEHPRLKVSAQGALNKVRNTCAKCEEEALEV